MIYAIDIGGTKIAFGVFASPSELVRCDVVATPSESWPALVERVRSQLADYGRAHEPAARIGVSVAGAVRPDGVVLATNLPAIHGRPLAADLEAALGIPVAVANDADCFALAEHLQHAGTGEVAVAVILGTGVGGGVVVRGQLLRGADGIVGEWGHGNHLDARVRALGLRVRACPCGLGTCLDLYGGGRGLANIYRDLGGAAVDAEGIVGRAMIADRATEDGEAVDRVASRAIACWLELVAPQLAGLFNVLGPSRIVVGGGLANSSWLIARLDAAVREFVLAPGDEPRVVVAAFANDGSLRGAACL